MRVVQVTEFGPPDRLVAAEVPDPSPGAGQILIRLAAASVNRADALLRAGGYHILPPLPVTPGTEGAGFVEALGAGVDGFAIGDRVVAWGVPGFYAELVVAEAKKVVLLPPSVDFDVAAALPVTWLSARYCLNELARVRKGDVVLIHAAASGVGSAAIQVAKHAGAAVIAVVGSSDKEAFVRNLGADHVVLRGDQDLVEQVMRLTDKRGADVVLDLAGGEAFAQSVRAVAQGGRVVAMANVALTPSTIDTRDFYPKNVTIFGFQFTNLQRLGWNPRPDLIALLDLVAAGRFVVSIDQRFPLTDAAAAHRRIESNETRGKILLTVGS